MPARTVTLTADSPVLAGPVIYRGGLLKATAGGAATVDLWDGDQATTFDPLDSFGCAASGHDRNYMDDGLFCLRGIFADLGANVLSFTLFYDVDLPEALGGPRSP